MSDDLRLGTALTDCAGGVIQPPVTSSEELKELERCLTGRVAGRGLLLGLALVAVWLVLILLVLGMAAG